MLGQLLLPELRELIQLNDSADDHPPVIQSRSFGGKPAAAEDSPARGLLPDVQEAAAWREGARRLLDASCHLGPLRDPVQTTYNVNRSSPDRLLPDRSDNVAQLLLSDVDLRAAVGDWMVKHLEGWRVDVRQSLDVFNLVARRAGREGTPSKDRGVVWSPASPTTATEYGIDASRAQYVNSVRGVRILQWIQGPTPRRQKVTFRSSTARASTYPAWRSASASRAAPAVVCSPTR